MSFVGRGERRVKQVLESLFHGKAAVLQQVHIISVIKKEDYQTLGKEHNQHKFDLVVIFHRDFYDRPDIVVEVNFKHGDIAGRKWNNVYYPAILKSGKIPLTIEDRECRSIFDVPHERELRWMDYIDVINALDLVRVTP